jgi:hypothetical protein
MSFDLDTSEKIVSIIAGFIAIIAYLSVKKKAKGDAPDVETKKIVGDLTSTASANGNKVTINVNPQTKLPAFNGKPVSDVSDVPSLKRSIRVLFIDDDKDFKIVKVLKRMGWEYVKIVTDITSLENPSLVEANVVFVDIQGVGKSMQCSDEGLGLTLAIRRRYPEKKIIIYSAEEEGPRFHDGFHAANYSLQKFVDPIRFEDAIVKVFMNE